MELPQNTVALEGTEVLMRCRTTSTKLIWMIFSNGSGTFEFLFAGNRIYSQYTGTYSIASDGQGQINLKFRATSSLSPHYMCEEPTGKERAVADLIVLGKLFFLKFT